MRFDGAGARRWAAPVLSALAAAALLLVPAAARAAGTGAPVSPAVVGGTQIPITQAPWAVAVTAKVSADEVAHCSGSILNASEVLTAAHCVFDEAGDRVPPESIYIQAGVSNFEALELEQQEIPVKEVRVHPYYVRIPDATQANPDDVAVLKLERAIELNATAEPIPLSAAGSILAEGAAVSVAGFGEEEPLVKLTGALNLIGMKIVPSQECGGEADALFVCARTADGSVCFGDSGSGLTIPGSAATLTGVTNTVEEKCADGALGGFANVAAPEIRDFIEGSETPPKAPRGGAGLTIRGVVMAGHSLMCEPGSWTNGPTITYSYIDSTSGAVLQTGPSDTYALTAADVGRTILCEVMAANAGGRAVLRTRPLQAVEPAATKSAPPPGGTTPPGNTGNTTTSTAGQTTSVESVAGAAGSVSLLATSIAVQGNGTASVKVDCQGIATCHGKLTLSTKNTVDIKGKQTLRTVPIGTASFSVPGGRSKTVSIKLGPVGRVLLSTAHGHLSAKLSIVKLEPAPRQSQVKAVQLVQQRARSGTK